MGEDGMMEQWKVGIRSAKTRQKNGGRKMQSNSRHLQPVEELGLAEIRGVREHKTSVSIKGARAHARPLAEGQQQIGGRQHIIVSARRSTPAAEHQVRAQ